MNIIQTDMLSYVQTNATSPIPILITALNTELGLTNNNFIIVQ